MEFSFTTTSWMVFFLIISLLAIIPVKLGAEAFSAPNREVKYCVLAVIVGSVLTIISMFVAGSGLLGLVLVFGSICLSYWFILKIPLLISFFFTIIVIFLQFAMVKLLSDFGVLS